MKYLRYALLAIVLLFCVTIALANRAPVTLDANVKHPQTAGREH